LPFLPEKMPTPEDEELERKQASLAELEAQLADRELELASFGADLIHFENRDLQTIGRSNAILDDRAFVQQNKQKKDLRDYDIFHNATRNTFLN
jgi:hypothetical protein